MFTEKNKLAPSQYSIPLIFDKKWGVIPVLSEYYFLREKTRTENKYWPKTKKLIYPFCITTDANSKRLSIMDPTTGSIIYTSEKFMERNFINVYNSDQNFRYWFDKAVEISVEQRIKVALFRNQPHTIELLGSGVENNEVDVSSNVEKELTPEQQLNELQPQSIEVEPIPETEHQPIEIKPQPQITEEDMNKFANSTIQENLNQN